ncbi:TIGR02206 family membrane protein [Ectobacillus sp. sgz5001026]|uniref:YwaF family protein n=1 Tax=Ectobacillus sp. sgz5001026 TaxID=3242473 RepID=UPI0036D2988E
MQPYFQKDYPNHPFQLFSEEHLLTVLTIGLLCMCLFMVRTWFAESKRNHLFCYSLAILLILAEASYHIWFLYFHIWSLGSTLPLHLSDISILLSIVMLVTRSVSLFRFLYFAGISSSIQAMLTPDLGIYSFPHFRYIDFYVSHGGVILACIFMLAVEKYKPTFRSLWMSVLIVNLYAGCVFLINRFLHANYLYLMKKPEISSILNYLGPWPWYLLSVEGVLIISFLLLYSPFWIKQKLR